MDNETISERIKYKRKKMGMTQQDLANAVNVSLMTVVRWENGKRTPNTSIMPKLAKTLGTSIEYLMGLNDPLNISNTQNTVANDDTDSNVLFTGGAVTNMFIIKDKNTGRVYYLPNNEDGRSIFLSVLTSGLNGSSIPILSNTITGDNNSGNKLGVINS